MGKQTPISAKIDTTVLEYCKANGGKLNTLINDLLRGWMLKNQEKQLIAFQIETGTDELSQLGTDPKCSQCCKNCIYLQDWKNGKSFVCGKNRSIMWDNPTTYCCIYWKHKKKGSK